jgi:hypothetical protein
MNQLRGKMETGILPLFVCEASHSGKLQQIKNNSYLEHTYSGLRKLSGALYIHGSKLDQIDQHLWDEIGKSSIDKLCVSYHDGGNAKEKEVVFANAK